MRNKLPLNFRNHNTVRRDVTRVDIIKILSDGKIRNRHDIFQELGEEIPQFSKVMNHLQLDLLENKDRYKDVVAPNMRLRISGATKLTYQLTPRKELT
jgi:hypothetical protein